MEELILGLITHVFGGLGLYAICFWPGWLALKILTLGRYPRKRQPNVDREPEEIETVAIVGLLFVGGLVAALAYLFSPGTGH